MYVLIAPQNVDKHWSLVAPWIAQAMDRMDNVQGLDSIRLAAISGMAQIWVGHAPVTEEIEVVMVTEGAMVNGEPVCLIRLLSGQGAHNWLSELCAFVECWAKQRGFKHMQVWGRKGWERVLRHEGYTHEATVLMKPLDHEVH